MIVESSISVSKGLISSLALNFSYVSPALASIQNPKEIFLSHTLFSFPPSLKSKVTSVAGLFSVASRGGFPGF